MSTDEYYWLGGTEFLRDINNYVYYVNHAEFMSTHALHNYDSIGNRCCFFFLFCEKYTWLRKQAATFTLNDDDNRENLFKWGTGGVLAWTWYDTN